MKKSVRKRFDSSISCYNGDVTVNFEDNPSVIEINFKGLIVVNSHLPQGFFISVGNSKLIIIRLSDAEMPELVFSYLGSFKIINAKMYSPRGVSKCSIDNNLHFWKNVHNTFALSGANWSDYDDGYDYIPDNREFLGAFNSARTSKKSIAINRNFGSNLNGFYLDGKKYNGDIAYDSRGIFMTPDKKILKTRLNKNRLKQILRKRSIRNG